MADAYLDVARELISGSGLRMPTKGTGLDRLYIVNRTWPSTKEVGKFPAVNKISISAEFVPGAAHPHCSYLILVEASRTGGDDTNQNWQLLYRVDLKAFVTAYNIANPGSPLDAWPDLLIGDNHTKTDAQGDTTQQAFDWVFEVINPENYTQPPLYDTEHPSVAGAILVREAFKKDGPIGTVERRYELLPTTALTSVEANSNPEPPDIFVDVITREVETSVQPTSEDVDAGADVMKSEVLAIDEARRKKRTITSSWTDPSQLFGYEVDGETGQGFETTKELVAPGTLGFGVRADGYVGEVSPLNTNWSILTTRKAYAPFPGNSRTWDDVIHYPLPAVLGGITIATITNGGYPVDTIVTPIWTCDAYDGPIRATITETWSLTPPGLPAVVHFKTTPVVHDGVFLKINIGPCLHAAYLFYETSGTAHPNYDYFSISRAVAATPLVRWPSSFLAFSKVSPHRGGYIRRNTVGYAPA